MHQNRQGLNDDKEARLRKILNEIDAKQFLLKNQSKYRIPRLETELTEKQLYEYQRMLDEYQKKGERLPCAKLSMK